MSDMLAVYKPAARPGVELRRAPIPRPGRGEVLLRVEATSICGTDLHIYDWDGWAESNMKPPLIPGHEFAGEVVDRGEGVASLAVGDRISVESHIPCDRCVNCRSDKRHICTELRIFGIHLNGSFAEYVAVPEVCAWKRSAGLPAEVRSIMEPMGNAVHAVDEARVAGANVAVFGCGPAGLFAVAVARAMKAARVVALDINPDRLKLAATMGATETLDARTDGLVDVLREMTGGAGFDATLEMSGAAAAFTGGLRALRPGGRLIAFGLPRKDVTFDLANDVIMKQRSVIGIVGRHMWRTWETMQALLDGGLDPTPAITHTFRLSEFEAAIETIKSGAGGKVVLRP